MARHALRHTRQKLFRKQAPVTALPTALMYDNFTAANETTLNGRTPPVRNNSNNWSVPQGNYTINNNRVEARFPSGGQAVSTFDLGQADVDMRVTVIFPVNGSGRTGGFTFRYQGNSDRWSTTANADLGVYRIIETTGGTSTIRAESNFAFQPNVPYTLRLTLVGDVITTTIEGVGEITYTSSVGNTRTRHGLRANNTVGSDPIIFDDFIILDPPNASDVQAAVSANPYATSVTRMSMTIVDNNLNTNFAGATDQKSEALSNLANKFHHLNMFLESFGNGTTLGSWDGISDDVEDLPDVDLSSFTAHWTVLDNALNPDTWGVFGYRIPWQFTGKTNSSGVTTKSTSADYNDDGRRLLTNKRAQFVEWVAQWSAILMSAPYNFRRFYLGSEAKGFQSVVPVSGIRAARSQSWEWDDYAGTPGRADMGQFAFYLAYREGLMQGAEIAEVDWSEIRIVSPYPVIAHQGEISSGLADAVTFDSRNDDDGNPVDFSDMNGSNPSKGGWGWPNKAAAILTAEHIRLLEEYGITTAEWEFGSDFGTFNNDNVPTPNINDHDLAYRRVKGHNNFYKKLLTQYGFDEPTVVKRYPEYYAKAQYEMDQGDEHAIDEELRDDYQASIRAAFLFAAYEDLIHYPDMWSPFGRGDQSTTAGVQSDPNQWYGGMVKRTVTDNNDHSGSAVTDGGEPQAALALIFYLKQNFPPGTPLHSIVFTSPDWKGIASDTHAAVINQTNQTLTLSINNDAPVEFGPYEFKVVAYS